MEIQKKVSNFLLAVVLLYVTFEKAEGRCHTKTWDNASNSIKEKSGFVCKSGDYLICDKDSVSNPDLESTCGVKLNCSGKGVTSHVSITLKHDINDPPVWIDMNSCGLDEVMINPGSVYYVNISVIDLSSNAIRHITTDLFSGNKTVQTLLFTNNKIVAVVGKPLLGLQVSELDMSGNSLQEVDANPFSGLTSLETLRLSRNKISTIGSSSFDGSKNLNYLDLSHNTLENVPADVFMQLGNLKTLIMSHNRLVAVEPNSFLGLSLNLLDLSNNPLQSIDSACFNKTSVTKLDISGCEFEQFPQNAVRILDENLKEVNLSGNRIASFPTVGFDQDFLLQSLDLSHNLMESVDCCWLGDNLKFLYLHGNAITTIERCLFTERMFTLTSFSLADNPLDCCQMYWLKEIATASKNLLDLDRALCIKPMDTPFLETENCKDDSSSKTFKTNDIIAAVIGTFFATLCLISVASALIFLIRRRTQRLHSSDSGLRKRLPLPDIPTPGAKNGESLKHGNTGVLNAGVEPTKQYQKLQKPIRKNVVVKTGQQNRAAHLKKTTKATAKGTTPTVASAADDMDVYQELDSVPKCDTTKGGGTKSTVADGVLSAQTSTNEFEQFYEDTAPPVGSIKNSEFSKKQNDALDDYEEPVSSTTPSKKVTTFGKGSSDATKPKEDFKKTQEQTPNQTTEEMYENIQASVNPTNSKAEEDTLPSSAAKTAEKGSPSKGPANAKRSSSTTGPSFTVCKREPGKQRVGVVKQLTASYDARM